MGRQTRYRRSTDIIHAVDSDEGCPGATSISGATCGSSRYQRASYQHAYSQATSAAADPAAAAAATQQQDAVAADIAGRQAAANALLQLLSPDAELPRPLKTQQLPGGAGVGLVATRDVPPDAPLLAVPFSLVLQTADREVRSCAHLLIPLAQPS